MVSGEVTGHSISQGAELILEDGVIITENAPLAGRLSILETGPGRQREHETERCLERKVERKTNRKQRWRERGMVEPSSPGVPGLPQPREQSPAEG